MNIESRTALVFGGSRGIGAAAVKRLAEDGYAVGFTYANSEDQATALVELSPGNGVKPSQSAPTVRTPPRLPQLSRSSSTVSESSTSCSSMQAFFA